MTDPGTLARDIVELQEQLDAGELTARDHALLRERAVLRAAAPACARTSRSASGAAWAVGGLVVALLVAIALVPAVRDRGPGDYGTGNDFSESRGRMGGGIAEWTAAERALGRGDVAGALRRYRLAVAFLPERADLRSRFGFALAQTGRTVEAVEQLKLAERSAPTLPEAHLYLGVVLTRAQRRRAAVPHLRRYLRLAPRGTAAPLARRLIGR